MNQDNYTSPAEQPARKRSPWLWIGLAVVVLCCCVVVALVAAYYGYDQLGDPLGIYGSF